jgi:hypothetical protein
MVVAVNAAVEMPRDSTDQQFLLFLFHLHEKGGSYPF